MLGAGTVINPIIKIVTVVAILAAVYFFIVKPTLDTTEDLTNRAFENVPNAEEILEGFNTLPNSDQIQQDIQDSLDAANGGQDTDRLLACIQSASQDAEKIQRCAQRFGP